jgi:hypothetical protein
MSRAIRVILVLYVVGLVIIAACTSQKPADKVPDTKAPGNAAPTTSAPPTAAPTSSNPGIAKAQELLAKDDSKAAIRLLEDLAKTEHPIGDELKAALIDAHDKYLTTLSIMRNIPPDQKKIFMEVMYMHAARILELKPDHPGALAQQNSVMVYYKLLKQAPPATIDPLMFLDDRLAQAGGSPSAAGPSAPKGAGK